MNKNIIPSIIAMFAIVMLGAITIVPFIGVVRYISH